MILKTLFAISFTNKIIPTKDQKHIKAGLFNAIKRIYSINYINVEQAVTQITSFNKSSHTKKQNAQHNDRHRVSE